MLLGRPVTSAKTTFSASSERKIVTARGGPGAAASAASRRLAAAVAGGLDARPGRRLLAAPAGRALGRRTLGRRRAVGASGSLGVARASSGAGAGRRSSQRREVLEEARVGDRRRLHAVDLDALARARPATAPSIARRWSPRESIVPPAQAAGAAHDEAVVGRLDVAAERRSGRRRPRDAVGLLEAQLPRAADDVSPSAKQPSSATSGSSSIASGTSSASTIVPDERAAGRTSMSLIGSLAGIPSSGRRSRSPTTIAAHPLEDLQEAGAGPVDAAAA